MWNSPVILWKGLYRRWKEVPTYYLFYYLLQCVYTLYLRLDIVFSHVTCSIFKIYLYLLHYYVSGQFWALYDWRTVRRQPFRAVVPHSHRSMPPLPLQPTLQPSPEKPANYSGFNLSVIRENIVVVVASLRTKKRSGRANLGESLIKEYVSRIQQIRVCRSVFVLKKK